MEKDNKIVYLFMGMVIGALITATTMFLLDSGDDHLHEGGITIENEHEGHDEHEAPDENEGPDEEDIVEFTDAEMKEFGIVVKKVGEQELQLETELTGEVAIDPQTIARITPRFGGIVKAVYVKIGERVRKGDTLATIESNESLVVYEMIASVDGIVLEMNMLPGEIADDESNGITIADLRIVWAELDIYQKDLSSIHVGQRAKVYFDSIENAIEGRIFYISPIVDEHTRTSTARIKLYNTNGQWKPGMFITALVGTEKLKAELAVTRDAIQNFEGNKVVFVGDEHGFRPHPITTGRSNSMYTEILSGLEVGQSYIAKGAFVFKSELLKESFGGGHHH